MPSHRPRLILFPGLGIDEGLFERQLDLPVDLEFPTMPRPRRDESLRDYSLRVASDIDPTAPLYLGGVSFGAMVALEAARVLHPRGVFIISGCTAPEQISPVIRAGAMAGTFVPRMLYPLGRFIAPAFLRLLGPFDRREWNMLVRVFHRIDFDIARWGAKEIMRWTAPADCSCPIHWIHGSIDHIVPPDGVNPDLLVPGAGHFLNVSHPRETNDFIASRLVYSPPQPDGR